MAKAVMQKFYRRAEGQPERLPWYQQTPPRLLQKAVSTLGGRGRALDVGSGAGIFTVWLAKQGLDVTGIDLFPEATDMARELAEKNGVQPTLLTGDLFTFVPSEPFDLVVDSGCLHALVGGDVDRYKRHLLRWLTSRGCYLLGHWGKRHALDWRPIGPRRRSQAEITRLFSPELRLRESDVTDFAAPMPFGPTVRGVEYWFERLTVA